MPLDCAIIGHTTNRTHTMNTALLNEIAARLGTTDKNLVISAAIKGLVDLGYNVRTAYEMVMGDGSFGKMAEAVQAELIG